MPVMDGLDQVEEFLKFVHELKREQLSEGIVYVAPRTLAWIEETLESIPTHLCWNHIAFVYVYAFPLSVKARMNPNLAQRITVEFARMISQGFIAKPEPTVFISYAREDIDAARRLYQDLKQAGVEPWFDKESLLPGQKWRVAIRQAIRECRYFLAVLSTNSVTKRGYIQKELAVALEVLEEFPESAVFIIPVRLDNCHPSHEKLRELHWVDMFPRWDNGLTKMLEVIHAEGEKPETTTTVSVAQMRMPDYSTQDILLAYLGTLLYKLQDHTTEAYLKTASLANPSYAFHDEGHSARVSNHLEQLASLHEPTVRLNLAEYSLVMAGAWTHDIGFAQSSHREIHHEQAREIICNDKTIQAYLGNDETAIGVVAKLAFNHSSKVDVTSIEDWQPTVELIPGQSHLVRVRHLSCLLRLADALDIDKRRAIRNPVLLQKLKSSDPVSYAYHLCHQRIQYVGINSQTRQIDMRAMVQTKIDQDRIRRFINERLKLRREVKTLVPYLWQYIPGLKDELNLDIQLTPQAPRLPASIVSREFLNGK